MKELLVGIALALSGCGGGGDDPPITAPDRAATEADPRDIWRPVCVEKDAQGYCVDTRPLVQSVG